MHAARFEQLAPWPVRFLDPAPAIARRVADLIGAGNRGAPPGPARAVFTSGRVPSAALAATLAGFGLAAAQEAGKPANVADSAI